MFVHFRRRYRRLAVGIGQSQYVNGKSHTAFAASLGSVALPEPIALPERRAFWQQLDSRFAAIAARFGDDRVSPADQRKIIAGIEARIPKPTETEERQAEVRAAVGKARLAAEKRGKRAVRRREPRHRPSQARGHELRPRAL